MIISDISLVALLNIFCHSYLAALHLQMKCVVYIAEYDWLMAEADGQPSDYITSVIIFLRTTFESFTNLPVSTCRNRSATEYM